MRYCGKGPFQLNNGVVASHISWDTFYSMPGQKFAENSHL